jgi:hypothetical protein
VTACAFAIWVCAARRGDAGDELRTGLPFTRDGGVALLRGDVSGCEQRPHANGVRVRLDSGSPRFGNLRERLTMLIVQDCCLIGHCRPRELGLRELLLRERSRARKVGRARAGQQIGQRCPSLAQPRGCGQERRALLRVVEAQKRVAGAHRSSVADHHAHDAAADGAAHRGARFLECAAVRVLCSSRARDEEDGEGRRERDTRHYR